ncbi:hypothetical protein DFH06DRAFT_1481714 [Mycena polygramma]|nr:hypothetical protein DFH06DRAFT_1481714 [Mycena polygramma]
MSCPSASSGSSSFVLGSARHAQVPSPALLQLLRMKLDCHVIRYVVDCVCSTVDYALDTGCPVLPARRARFEAFVSTVLTRAETRMPALLVALVYITRVRPHLCVDADEWAYERVFLGALVCAAKCTSDVHLKNAHWALCTGVFSKWDVGRIEREFLDVVEWRLGVREKDLLAHYPGLMAATASASTPTSDASEEMRMVYPPPQLPHQRSHHPHERHRSPPSSVPVLEPSSPSSSPHSSLGSPSPRTPPSPPPSAYPPLSAAVYPHPAVHTATYPYPHPAAPAPAHKRRPADVPMDVRGDEDELAVPAHGGGDFDDLLCAFSSPRTRRARHWA